MLFIFGKFIPRPTLSVSIITPDSQILASLLSVEIKKYDDFFCQWHYFPSVFG